MAKSSNNRTLLYLLVFVALVIKFVPLILITLKYNLGVFTFIVCIFLVSVISLFVWNYVKKCILKMHFLIFRGGYYE